MTSSKVAPQCSLVEDGYSLTDLVALAVLPPLLCFGLSIMTVVQRFVGAERRVAYAEMPIPQTYLN